MRYLNEQPFSPSGRTLFAKWFGGTWRNIVRREQIVAQTLDGMYVALSTVQLVPTPRRVFRLDVMPPRFRHALANPQTGPIELEPAFFNQPILSRADDTQVGTVIHEAGHYVGLMDLKHGRHDSQALASTGTDGPLINADSYAYYCVDSWLLGGSP